MDSYLIKANADLPLCQMYTYNCVLLEPGKMYSVSWKHIDLFYHLIF